AQAARIVLGYGRALYCLADQHLPSDAGPDEFGDRLVQSHVSGIAEDKRRGVVEDGDAFRQRLEHVADDRVRTQVGAASSCRGYGLSRARGHLTPLGSWPFPLPWKLRKRCRRRRSSR